MEKINILPAHLHHVDAIISFQLQMALETENLKLDKDILSHGVNAVFQDASKGSYYIAEYENLPIASLLTTYEWSDWRNGQVLWIQSVFVRPDFRRKGIYKKMYNYLLDLTKKDKTFKGIRLYVDKSNSQAQGVYLKLGMGQDHYQLFEYLFVN